MSYRPARPPSPTNTNFSGISNYRSESYRPIRDREVPAVPQIDSKKVARVHFEELQSFLSSHLAREPPNTRAGAREKLTRLTRQQFQELSTDVYDELIRRNSRSETPHLPNRDDFHPKRNQARQKLSTLPKPRFKDLASDVYFELGRRYPEFKEPELLPDTPESAYEEFPSNPNMNQRDRAQPQGSGRPSQETYRTRSPDNYNAPSRLGQVTGGPSRGPERRATPEQQYGRRSEENKPFGRQPSQASRGDDGESMYSGPRRRPSNDPDSQFARKPVEAIPPGPSSATSGVVIPNKSTIAEEEIQVPYGRDSSTRESNIRDSIVTDGSGNEDISNAVKQPTGLAALGSSGPPAWDKSPLTPLQGGLSALAAGFDKRNESALDDDDDDVRTANFETSTVGRARSASGSSSATRKVPEARGGLDREETEKMRRDYEYRITSLQAKVASLQEEVDQAAKVKKDDEERVRELTGEISSIRSKQSEQAAALRDAERRLADEQDARGRLEQQAQQTQQFHQQEIRKIQQQHEDLQKEHSNKQSFGESQGIIDDLQQGMEALLEEVKELASQNEELSSSKDEDLATIRDLEEQAADYRKKYERAKTELRGLKATSQLFLQKPKNDDQLPTSRTGAIQDAHITAFQSAADSLLSAGRSDAPSRVLVPVKAVVDAVSSIVEDARSYDLRQRSEQDPPIDYAHIENLCERAEATLSNLVTATKTHATSYGLSPVSLLDAALSHVSASVTELAKLLLIRRSPRDGENGMANGLSNGKYNDSPYGREQTMSPPNVRDQRSRGDMFGQSLSSSPPTMSGDSYGSQRSAPESAGRRDWSDLKPYLDAQSEQLVTAIQGVLTAVRNPSPTLELNDNVTQVITIVSSIVAVCRDSLPMSSRERGEGILATLTDHCDRLSEVQSERNVTKESRQVMAQSSFAIASVVKDLMKL